MDLKNSKEDLEMEVGRCENILVDLEMKMYNYKKDDSGYEILVQKKKTFVVDLNYNYKKDDSGSGLFIQSKSDDHRNMDDIVHEILLRLPVKSLVRYKSLSKQWQNFISYNPSFRESYISRHRTSCFLLLGFFFWKHHVLTFVQDEEVRFLPTSIQGRSSMLFKKRKREEDGNENHYETSTTIPLAPSPSPAPSLFLDDEPLGFLGHHPTICVVGSSHGFLLSCREREYPMNYIICNPINKQSLALPPPKTRCRYVTHGFICHTTHPSLDRVHSYKVVRVLYSNPGLIVPTRTVEIFSSDLPEWKVFNLTLPYPFHVDAMFSPAVISEEQGLIYVPVFVNKQESRHGDECVLVFNQRKEYSQFFDLPPRQAPERSARYLGQSDGLILYARHELGQLRVWALDETTREWSLKHKVGLEITMEKCPQFVKHRYDECLHMEAFHPMNPRILFLTIGDKKVLCEVDTSRLEIICDFAKQGWNQCYYLYPYMYGLIGPHLFLDD